MSDTPKRDTQSPAPAEPPPSPQAQDRPKDAAATDSKPVAVVEPKTKNGDIEVGSRIDAMELFQESHPPSGIEEIESLLKAVRAKLEEADLPPPSGLDTLEAIQRKPTPSGERRASGLDEIDALLERVRDQKEEERPLPASGLNALDAFLRKPSIEERLPPSTSDNLSAAEREQRIEETEAAPSQLDALMQFRPHDPDARKERDKIRARLTGTGELDDASERPSSPADPSPPATQLEALLHFSTRRSLRARREDDTAAATDDAPPGDPPIHDAIGRMRRIALQSAHEDELDTSTMMDVFHTMGRMGRTDGPSEPHKHDGMGQLLRQEAPRLILPPRQRVGMPREPDGITPMQPDLEIVEGVLSADQQCTGCEPVQVREEVHERLEFRHNRFIRLRIHRPVYICPNVANAPEQVAASPAFWCQDAPIGNGLLAKTASTLYFDRLSIGRLVTLLDQLGAPIPGDVLLKELNRTSTMLAPIVDVMRAEATTAEAPLGALVTGGQRDIPGAVSVHTGGGHIVFAFSPDEARATDANRHHGPAALRRWRRQGHAQRWSNLRQRLFLSLLTDPVRARRGLHIIQKLSPVPPTGAAELAELRRWLDGIAGEFERPQTRFEHVVASALTMWPLLLEEDASFRAQINDTWVVEASDGDVDSVMRWLSLIESCVLQQIQPWTYLYQLLQAIVSQPALSPKEWTPQAVAARS